MIGNGLQKPLAIPTVRVSTEEAITNTVATTREVVSTTALLMFTVSLHLGLHFIYKNTLFRVYVAFYC